MGRRGRQRCATVSEESRTHARKSLDQHIPERGQFLQQQKQFNAEAKRLYPELANQESEFAKLFAEVRNGPAGTFFQAMPGWAWQMARWVRGYMAEQGDSKKSSGLAKRPPAPVPKPSSAPATGNADEAITRQHGDQVYVVIALLLESPRNPAPKLKMANPLYSHTVITQDGSHRDLLDAITLGDAKETLFSPWSPRVRHPSISTLSGPWDKQLAPVDSATIDGTDLAHSNTAGN